MTRTPPPLTAFRPYKQHPLHHHVRPLRYHLIVGQRPCQTPTHLADLVETRVSQYEPTTILPSPHSVQNSTSLLTESSFKSTHFMLSSSPTSYTAPVPPAPALPMFDDTLSMNYTYTISLPYIAASGFLATPIRPALTLAYWCRLLPRWQASSLLSPCQTLSGCTSSIRQYPSPSGSPSVSPCTRILIGPTHPARPVWHRHRKTQAFFACWMLLTTKINQYTSYSCLQQFMIFY